MSERIEMLFFPTIKIFNVSLYPLTTDCAPTLVSNVYFNMFPPCGLRENWRKGFHN